MSRTFLGLSGLVVAAALTAAPAAAQSDSRMFLTTPAATAQPQAAYAAQRAQPSTAGSYWTQPQQQTAASSWWTQPQQTAYGADPLVGAGSGEYDDGSYSPQATATPRQIVNIDLPYKPGTIVVSTEERRLYYVLGNGQAVQYAVGVGRPGFEWAGTQTVSRKREWPDWRPPAEMLQRRPDLPRYMPGGPDNPLGARALYLGNTLYRIHGSNEPETIGQAVSSGCIRMTNEDVTDLYNRVKVGARVVVI